VKKIFKQDKKAPKLSRKVRKRAQADGEWADNLAKIRAKALREGRDWR